METPNIKFGTDGWRGIIADDFTFANLRLVAQGVANYLNSRGPEPLAVIGYDCRFGAEAFSDEVAAIFSGNGIRTLIFDRPSPTQVASWTVIDRKAAGAVAITASHNPYMFNGVKYKPETGSSAPTEVIRELEERIAGLSADSVKKGERQPLVEIYDPMPAYVAQIGRMVDLDALRAADLKVLHECMYGSGYGYVAGMLDGGSTRVVELHADRNPFFGGVNPEPITPNLGAALATMKSGGYDLCIATDGDADRVGIIDEGGRFINQLQVYALLMLYLFEIRGMRGPVVRALNMTSMADKLAKEFGVPVYEVPVGFKFVAPKMMEVDAVLGGEESGGFGFRGHIPERDGILAGLFFADMILRYQKPISEILADLEKRVGPHFYERRDIRMPRDSYDRDREVILKTMRDQQPKIVAGVKVESVRDDDGFKFNLADGSWVLLRVSGTEPLVRIYSEAASPEAVKERLDTIQDIIGVGGHGAVKRREEARVDKPWGYEDRWAITDRYLGKILHIAAGQALSLQYHNAKDECILVVRGEMDLELDDDSGKLVSHRLKEGDTVHITPGRKHRMTAVTDTDVFEVSTPEIDDVVRLDDRYGRTGT